MKGSSGAPTLPIWMRWSITENQVKPWSSAHCALAFTASKISAGSEPNSQDGLWMPNFMPFLLHLWLSVSCHPARGKPRAYRSEGPLRQQERSLASLGMTAMLFRPLRLN